MNFLYFTTFASITGVGILILFYITYIFLLLQINIFRHILTSYIHWYYLFHVCPEVCPVVQIVYSLLHHIKHFLSMVFKVFWFVWFVFLRFILFVEINLQRKLQFFEKIIIFFQPWCLDVIDICLPGFWSPWCCRSMCLFQKGRSFFYKKTNRSPQVP